MKRIAFVLAFIGLISPIGGERAEVILQEPNISYLSVLIEDGRNDDTSRLYLLTFHNPEGDSYYTIRELSFSKGRWHIVTVCSLPHIGVGGVLWGGMFLAQGRNDGINRLYVTSDSSLLEFTCSKGKWEDSVIVSYSAPLSYLIAAPLRNDNTIRLYARAQGSKIIEISYSGGKWIIKEIKGVSDSPFIGASLGRNDDTVRLYNMSIEITCIKESERIEQLPGYIYCIGKGRGDAVVRLYSSRWTLERMVEIVEYTYTEGKWEEVLIDTYLGEWTGGEPMRVGAARQDGRNRLYFRGFERNKENKDLKEGLYEYSFDGERWHWEFVPFPEPQGKSLESWRRTPEIINGVCPLAIGKVRDDDTSRVYCITSAGLVEVNMEATGIEERAPLENTPILLSLSPNPSYGRVRIYGYTTSPTKLKIYNPLGRLIREVYIPEKGKYTFLWNGSDRYGKPVRGGVYFCILKIPHGVITKKLVILRRKEVK